MMNPELQTEFEKAKAVREANRRADAERQANRRLQKLLERKDLYLRGQLRICCECDGCLSDIVELREPGTTCEKKRRF